MTRHGIPTRVEVGATTADGLRQTSSTRCEDMRPVGERRLVRRVGVVDVVVRATVARTLRRSLER